MNCMKIISREETGILSSTSMILDVLFRRAWESTENITGSQSISGLRLINPVCASNELKKSHQTCLFFASNLQVDAETTTKQPPPSPVSASERTDHLRSATLRLTRPIDAGLLVCQDGQDPTVPWLERRRPRSV